MPPRRANANLRPRTGKFRIPIVSLLFISVATPLVFLAFRVGNFRYSTDGKDIPDITGDAENDPKLKALRKIEGLFPREVLDVITSNTDDSGPLSLNVMERKDFSSSWVIEGSVLKEVKSESPQGNDTVLVSENSDVDGKDVVDTNVDQGKKTVETMEMSNAENNTTGYNVTDQLARQQMRDQRREKRVIELTQSNNMDSAESQETPVERKKEIDDNVLNKYSVWRQENDFDSDNLIRLVKDQLIMARVYASLAHSHNLVDLQRELNSLIKGTRQILAEANVDADLPRSSSGKIKALGQAISRARKRLYDCKAVTKKLRAMLQSSEEQALSLNKQSTVLRQLVAKTLPKGIHCLSMLLTSEYNELSDSQKEFPNKERLEDPSLFHYALFSDNVIAAAVVVNSTIQNAKEPEKHVFHLVTDKLNFAAMKMWFLENPPGKATINVENIDDFKWLNASYVPVLRQLQTASMKEYYFKSDQPTTLADASTNLKYRNPKYLSMLNHLRFYLPEVYPKLDKILFLDDDIVVKKDLTPLWSIDLHENVNGAVETCGESFHRFDKYLNFSNPLISKNFNPAACGWAYGMNIFDLKEWKKRDITGIYHRWQNLNEDRTLWKLGTLPPGLITFYKLTFPLNRSWHVLGLGYDPHVEIHDIEHAAVIHYNGNMKPWLELAMSMYKPYWTKYVNFNSSFLQQCNVIF